MDNIQRDEYPAIDGKSRRDAFPGLAHSGRPYREEDERSLWRLELALTHLSGYTVVREVAANGSISLGNRSRYVNVKLKEKRAFVTLDPVSVEWVVADKDGICHTRIKADELTAERIIGLNVNLRRPPRQKRIRRIRCRQPSSTRIGPCDHCTRLLGGSESRE